MSADPLYMEVWLQTSLWGFMRRCGDAGGKLCLLFFLLAGCESEIAVQSDDAKISSVLAAKEFTIKSDEGFFVIGSERVPINWSDIQLASGYQVVLARNADCSSEVISISVNSPNDIDLAGVADGVYHFCLFARVKSQLLPASNNGLTITVDRTPPVLKLPDSKPVHAKPFNPAVKVDDLTAVTATWTPVMGEIKVSSEAGTPSIRGGVNGEYAISGLFVDKAGNSSRVLYEFVWQQLGPVVTLDGDLVTATAKSFGVNVEESAVNFDWTFSDGPQGGEIQFSDRAAKQPTILATLDGTYKITLTASDVHANQGFATKNFTWDTTPPVLQEFAWGPGVASDGFISRAERDETTPAWELKVEAGTKADYTLALFDGNNSVICGADRQYDQKSVPNVSALVKDGIWTVCVRMTDLAGNIAYAKAQSLVRDTVPPVLVSLGRINDASDGWINLVESQSALPMWVLNGSSIATAHYSDPLDDDGNRQVCDVSQNYNLSSIPTPASMDRDGNFVLCVRIQDAAGNTVYGKSQRITRDTVPPTFVSMLPANDAADGYINNTEASSFQNIFNLVASDYSALAYSDLLNATNQVVTCDQNQTYGRTALPRIEQLFEDGVWATCVRLADAAGNYTYGRSGDVIRDFVAPVSISFTRTGVGSDGWVSGTERFSTTPLWSLSSSGASIIRYTVPLRDESSTLACGVAQSYTLTSIPDASSITTDGKYIVCARMTDAAGNSGYVKSPNVTRDTLAPVFNRMLTANAASDGVISAGEANSTHFIYTIEQSGSSSQMFTLPLPDSDVTCDAGKNYDQISIPRINVLTADGRYVVCARLSDSAGNVTYGKSDAVLRNTGASWVTLMGAPTGSSAANALAVNVFGNGIIQYKYKLRESSDLECSEPAGYSAAVEIAVPITDSLASRAEGTLELCVVGSDSGGQWQSESSAARASWIRDVTPPVAPQALTFPETYLTIPSLSFSYIAGSDALSSVTHRVKACTNIQCSIGCVGEKTENGNFATITELLENQSYFACAQSEDAAGNHSAFVVSPNSVLTDYTAPNITIASPAANFSSREFVNLTGACEANSDIEVSGSGVLSAISNVVCTEGSYTQQVYLSAGDGAKTITITATDAASNSASVSRSFVRDATAPDIHIVTPSSLPFYTASASVAIAGSCEPGLSIVSSYQRIGGSLTTGPNYNCDGNFSGNLNLSGGAGTYAVYLRQTDQVGNVGTLSFSVLRDTTAPILQFDDGSNSRSYTTPYNTQVFSGVCEGPAAAGVNYITVTGSGITESSNISCIDSAWTYTVPSQLVDGPYSYIFTQTDRAGNSTTINGQWVRDNGRAAIRLNTEKFISKNNTATFTGNCDVTTKMSVTTITISGSTNAVVNCSAGTFSYTTPAQTSDGTYTYHFSQTNSDGLESVVTGFFIRDTTPPVLGGFAVNEGSELSQSRVSLSLQATDGTTPITHYCFKQLLWSNSSTAPSAPSQPALTDACWRGISDVPVSKTPSKNIDIFLPSYLLSLVSGKYTVYAFVRDSAQNLSVLQANDGVDQYTATLTMGAPPQVEVIGITDGSSASASDFEVGDALVVHWRATDAKTIPSDAITLSWSSNLTGWSTIVSGLAHSATTNCTPIALATGCYRWVVPTDAFFMVRVELRNADGRTTENLSVPLNTSGRIKHRAGKLTRGLGYDARSFLMSYDNATDGRYGHANQFVVTRSGVIYLIDRLAGIVKVSPADNVAVLQWADTNTYSGDGALTGNTTFIQPSALYLDLTAPNQRLIVIDNAVPRLLDLDAGTITTLNTIDSVNLSYRSIIDIFPTPSGLYAWIRYNDPTATYLKDNGSTATYFPETLFLLDEATKKWAPFLFDRSAFTTTGLPFNSEADSGSRVDGQLPSTACDYEFAHRLPILDANGRIAKISTAIYDTAPSSATPRYACRSTLNLNVVHEPSKAITIDSVASSSTDPSLNILSGNYESNGHVGLNRKTYQWLRSNTNHVYEYDAGSRTWILTLGRDNGGVGRSVESSCVDGVFANSCDPQIYAIFVDEEGTLYFQDKGVIRLVGKDGKIATLMGASSKFFVTGTRAKNLPLGNGLATSQIYRFVDGQDEEIILSNFSSLTYQAIRGDTVSILAGNGGRGTPTIAASSLDSPAPIPAGYSGNYPRSYVADPTTGQIWVGSGNDILHLDRSITPPEWRVLIPDSCTNGRISYADLSHDSVADQPVCLDPTSTNDQASQFDNPFNYPPSAVAYDGSALVLHHGEARRFSAASNGTYIQNNYYPHNFVLFEVAPSSFDPVAATVEGADYLMGIRNFHPSTNTSVWYTVLGTNPVLPHAQTAATAPLISSQNSAATFTGMQKLNGEWYFVQQSDMRKLKKLTSDITTRHIQVVADVGINIQSFYLIEEGGDTIMYYCDYSALRRYNVDTMSSTQLDLRVPGLTCAGRSIVHHSDGQGRWLTMPGSLNGSNLIFSLRL